MMDHLYLLPPDSWSAEWTKGQGRPLVKVRFSPYLKLCVLVQAVCVCVCVGNVHPGCCPASGGGLQASFSLSICPGTASASPSLLY